MGFFLLMLVIFLIYRFDLVGLNQEVKAEKKQEIQLQAKMSQAFYQQLMLEDEIAESHNLKANLKNWQKKLIKSSDLNRLLKQIKKMALANQLQVDDFLQGIEEDKHGYVKVPVSIKVKGSYQGMVNFLSQVANLPWIVVVGDFDINNRVVMTANINLEIYYLS